MRKTRLWAIAIILLGAVAVVWQYSITPAPPAADASVLHRGLLTDPEAVDPHKARSTQAGDILRDLYEGLLSHSATGELVPGVAEEWTISDDGLTYTFTLREDARWSNGDPVTADDFVFSLQRLVDPETAAFYSNLVGDIVNASAIVAGELPPTELGVEAEDERTLVIRLQRPVPYMLGLLTYLSTYPVHRASLEAHGDEAFRPGNLVSNGAYVLEAWAPGSLLSLRRNEHYWNNADTAIDVVRYHVVVQELTQLNRFRAGELHVTDTVPPDAFAEVREKYAENLHIAPYLGVHYYGFNLTRPLFRDNPAIREALSLAIDREVLVERITGRGEQPAYSWVPPGVDNYEPRRMNYADETQEVRNTHARRLLAEAGYGPDNPLEIELRYNTSDTQRRMAVAIQAMWNDVLGVETTLVNEEFQVLLANMRAAEVTEVFRSSWIGDYNDAHTFLSIFESGNPSNMTRYSNAEYDDLMQRAANEVNPDHRRLLLEEAERVLLADHAAIPVYFIVSKHLVADAVRGWGDNVLDYHYSRHLSLAPESAKP